MTRPSDKSIASFIAINGGFVGVCLLFISVLLGQQTAPDHALRLALLCFAAALPFAALTVILLYNAPDQPWYALPFVPSAVGVLVGIGASLWHIDQITARVYVGAVAFSVVWWLIALFRTK